MTDKPQQPQPDQTPPPPHNPQQPGPSRQPQDPGPQGPAEQGQWQGQPQQGQWQSQPQQGGWQGQPMQGGQGPRLAESDERTWMLLAHLSAPIAAVISLGWLSLIGPLIVWFMRKDDSQAVRIASAGAFNFNVSFWLMNLIAFICFFTLVLIPVAIIIWIVVWPVAIYVHLRGAWLASKGQVYSYPFQLKVLT